MANDILNEEQCNCIDAVLQSVQYTRELILKCKDCGFDTAKATQENDSQEAMAMALKRNFAPQRM